MYLYCESKGILLRSSLVSGGRVTFAASTFSAPSVGPSVIFHSPLSSLISWLSLHRSMVRR